MRRIDGIDSREHWQYEFKVLLGRYIARVNCYKLTDEPADTLFRAELPS